MDGDGEEGEVGDNGEEGIDEDNGEDGVVVDEPNVGEELVEEVGGGISGVSKFFPMRRNDSSLLYNYFHGK